MRYGLLSANLALLVVVVLFVSSGPAPGESAKRSAAVGVQEDAVALNPLDQLSSADIAVNVARMVGLEEATAVVNRADTVNAQLTISPVEESLAVKPQIVKTDLKSKHDIKLYKTVSGDTIASIAAKFGVTKDSIRWSNNLTGESVNSGIQLYIPPVNGIVYKVKQGDTVDSLAQEYQASRQKLIGVNDAERGLKVGDHILIPDGVKSAPRSARIYLGYGFAWGGTRPVYSHNGYDYGQCTWHAANRRREIGRPVPSNLGDAQSWWGIADRNGLPTGTEPRKHAVLWHVPGYKSGGLGHVAFVERVNDDGSILVSDMNFGGWGVTYRTVPKNEITPYHYRFIY